MTKDKRPLGRSDIEITPLMLGGNVFGWTADEQASFAVLDAFVEAGGNAIDTADSYQAWIPGHQGGESEIMIGKWLAARGRRDRVVIATKVGMKMGDGSEGLDPARIERSVEASLKRLQTDYIDLYQAHRDDEAVPLDVVLTAFDRLVKAGKVRAIGASNYTAPRLEEALRLSDDQGLARYETLQPLYNLMERPAFEGALQDFCVENDIAVIPYFGLASGFLTGKYRTEADFEGRPRGAGVRKYLDERGKRVLAALDDVGNQLGATPAQVALAWLMAQPAIAAPIASATSVTQLKELMGALQVELDAETLTHLDEASALS